MTEGYRCYDYLDYVGSYGNYWSSSLGADNPIGAYVLDCGSNYVGTPGLNRFIGLSVRPVSE